ncbi:MAG: acyltransferase family protein [Terriglobales bacterium]
MSVRVPTSIVGRKLQSLDGLRAIAIILVFLVHVQNHIPSVNLLSFLIRMYAGLGWMGVDLFFVLSGFLITGILLDTREASNYFAGFYTRRILRIFPLYYLVLTTVLVAGGLLNSPEVTAGLPVAQDRWLYFCYLTNWLGLWKQNWGPHYVGYLAHFWSLAVEEQFYFVWPLVIWVVRPRAIPWVASAVAALAALIRLAWVAHSGAQMAISVATISRLDELFIGALCAFFFRDPERMVKVRKWLPWVASLGLGSFVLMFSGMLFFPVRAGLLIYNRSTVPHTLDEATQVLAECGGYSLLALGFGALVLLAAYTEAESTWMQKFLKSRLLGPIGIYSYGIYVFHVPIIGAAAIFVYPKLVRGVSTEREAVFTECAYIVLLAAVTFIVSALSYEFFEKRILRLKRYFEPEYAPGVDDAMPDDCAVAEEAIGS